MTPKMLLRLLALLPRPPPQLQRATPPAAHRHRCMTYRRPWRQQRLSGCRCQMQTRAGVSRATAKAAAADCGRRRSTCAWVKQSRTRQLASEISCVRCFAMPNRLEADAFDSKYSAATRRGGHAGRCWWGWMPEPPHRAFTLARLSFKKGIRRGVCQAPPGCGPPPVFVQKTGSD